MGSMRPAKVAAPAGAAASAGLALPYSSPTTTDSTSQGSSSPSMSLQPIQPFSYFRQYSRPSVAMAYSSYFSPARSIAVMGPASRTPSASASEALGNSFHPDQPVGL